LTKRFFPICSFKTCAFICQFCNFIKCFSI
jgi:hypothetical protein